MALVKITKKSGIPLIGCIAFGIVDRGTDLIQVRPTSICNLKCIFCSTNANNPEIHPTNYEVDVNYLIEYIEKVVEFKEVPVEANLDSVGELACYKKLPALIRGIRKIEKVKRISMQSNGLIIKDIIELEKAGLNQLNLSLNAMDAKLARELSGCKGYKLDRILALAKFVADSGIDLLIAPIWIPGLNDEEIPKIIEFAKKLGARLGIQKYEEYKYSRKPKGAKKINYRKFYEQLHKWGQEYGINLICTKADFDIKKAPRLPTKFKRGEKAIVEIVAPGWLFNQALAVGSNRCITINGCKPTIGKKVKIRITDNKNNIYMAEKIK